MPDKSTYCRLFVILAREASKAVIFRRGPRIWTEIILWDTKTDTFTEGQWFKGSLYPTRGDLSPDGSKMIYFAAKFYNIFRRKTPYPFTWTAVSRPPYLTTLATAKALGTNDGGGYFADNNTIVINQSRWLGDEDILPPVVVEKINVSQDVKFKPLAENAEIYYNAGFYHDLLENTLLERRGWKYIQGDSEWNADLYLYDNPILWRKDNPSHAYSLFMSAQSGYVGGYGQDDTWKFTLKYHQHQTEFRIDGYEWADWDQQGRLVYTHQGKLFAGQIRANGIEPVELADFNPNKVRLIESPPWAKTWDQVE